MKSFLVSITLFFTIMVLSIINGLYISHVCDVLSETVRHLPLSKTDKNYNDTDEIQTAINLWNKHKKFIGLSITSDYIHSIDFFIIQLDICRKSGNAPEFETIRKLLLLNIKRLKGNEDFSLDNII